MLAFHPYEHDLATAIGFEYSWPEGLREQTPRLRGQLLATAQHRDSVPVAQPVLDDVPRDVRARL